MTGGDLTEVPGVNVGHAGDERALTGCTVVLFEGGGVAGCDVRGSAPGTRETDLLRPGALVERVDAVLLAGGSAFGLDAAAGVMRWLEERGAGFPAGGWRVPIVPAAVIFDLGVGDPRVRPDAAMGYAACAAAGGGPLAQGSVGAGLGATVGKLLGMAGAMRGGIGNACVRLGDGVVVAALVVVNAFGDVRDPETGRRLAGARDPSTGRPVDTERHLLEHPHRRAEGGMNTTLGLVATDARLDKAAARKVAEMAHDGLARAISPVHTLVDGDAMFAVSLGDRSAAVTAVGTVAAAVTGRAVAAAVRNAAPLPGLPAWRDGGQR